MDRDAPDAIVMSPPACSLTACANVVFGPKCVTVARFPIVMFWETLFVSSPVAKTTVTFPSWSAVPPIVREPIFSGVETVTVNEEPSPSLLSGLLIVAVSSVVLGYPVEGVQFEASSQFPFAVEFQM